VSIIVIDRTREGLSATNVPAGSVLFSFPVFWPSIDAHMKNYVECQY